MTFEQRELIKKAKAAGYSKQEVADLYVLQVEQSDLSELLPRGEGDRKLVLWRLGPETRKAIIEKRQKLKTTYAQVLEAALKVAIDNPKPAI